MRYRVREKHLYDGLQANPLIYRYHADEASMNDLRHSQAAAYQHPYALPYTEFRGHAMVKQVGDDGRARFTFFHQDDIFKGKPLLELITQQTLGENFEYGAVLGSSWSLCAGSSALPTALYGDPAARLTGDSSERCFKRSAFNVQDSGSQPNAILGQALLQGSSAQARLALESASGHGLALLARPDGALQAQYSLGAGWVSEGNLLAPAGTLARDEWYVFLLIADEDESYLARIWPRQHPEQAVEYRRAFAPGQSWRFALYAQNGEAYLDTYSEGRLFSLSSTQLTHQEVPLGSNPLGLEGASVQWIYPHSETALQFDGDASWSGLRSSYAYHASYGNRSRSLEASWEPTTSAWRDQRLSLTSFEPFTDASHYLVGLPAVEQIYRCPQPSLNGACLNLSQSNALLASEQRYLYDGAFSGQPQQGLLTGQRRLLRFAGANFSDPRYADQSLVYDAWGNLTASVSYTAEGAAAALASGGAQPSYSVYDPLYHTYVLAQTNALAQSSVFSYDIDLGLPTSVVGPNGAPSAVSMSYDAFGRPLQVIRPGDDANNPTLQFTYHDDQQPVWIEARQRIQGALFATKRRFYDGLGRLAQTQSLEGAAGLGGEPGLQPAWRAGLADRPPQPGGHRRVFDPHTRDASDAERL